MHLYYLKRKISFLRSFVGPSDRVLEVGCGVGERGRLLSALTGSIVYGLDVINVMAKASKTFSGGSIIGDAAELPFRDEQFDLVYCINVLQHLKRLNRIGLALEEMARISRRCVIIFDLNPDNPYCRYVLFKVCPYDEGDERIPTPQELTSMANKSNLRLITFRQFGFIPQFTPLCAVPFFSRIESFFECRLSRICSQNFYVYTKAH